MFALRLFVMSDLQMINLLSPLTQDLGFDGYKIEKE